MEASDVGVRFVVSTEVDGWSVTLHLTVADGSTYTLKGRRRYTTPDEARTAGTGLMATVAETLNGSQVAA